MTKQFLIQVRFDPKTRLLVTDEQICARIDSYAQTAIISATEGPVPGVRVLHLVDAEKTDLSSHDTGFVRASQPKPVR